MQNPKTRQKIAIWAPSHNFVGLYLRNWGMYQQSEKNLLSSNISSTCPHNMVNFSPLAAQIDPVVWGTSATFNGFRILAALLHGTPVLGGVEQRAPPIFGRAAITLGIGPHCSWLCFHCACPEMSLRHCYSVMLPIFPHGEAYFGDWGHFWSLCYL